MNNTNTGEPAFPTGIFFDDKGLIIGGSNGMTLRDYFAAKAMQVAWGMYEELYDCDPENLISLVADYAYELADSMLKAREA